MHVVPLHARSLEAHVLPAQQRAPSVPHAAHVPD
jgi:hypothetical protein